LQAILFDRLPPVASPVVPQAASTPRSDAAASEGGGEHKKRGGLFRALRRKGGSKANQALR
jgi:hypothetical protein